MFSLKDWFNKFQKAEMVQLTLHIKWYDMWLYLISEDKTVLQVLLLAINNNYIDNSAQKVRTTV